MTIRYATLGEGKPLVLLHGFTDSLETWDEVNYVTPLLASGRRLVLIDARGHGGSARPHEASAYAPRLRAADVIAVLDALDIGRADIFGYSMGGWTALNVARYFPERVDRLVVGGAHPFGQSMAFYRAAVSTDIGKWIALVEKLGGPMPDAWKDRVAANDIVALRAAVADDRPDISAELAGFDRPALVYAGSEDKLRGDIARMQQVLADARSVVLPDSNHITAFLRSELIMPHLLAFLAGEEARASGGP